MILVPRLSNVAIMGSKAVAGSWDLGQASGRWAEATACGSHLILITAPILATKDPHAFPTCFSELCTCSSHCLECPSQLLWGLFGLSPQASAQCHLLSDLVRRLTDAPSPRLPRHLKHASISTYHLPSSCLPPPDGSSFKTRAQS